MTEFSVPCVSYRRGGQGSDTLRDVVPCKALVLEGIGAYLGRGVQRAGEEARVLHIRLCFLPCGGYSGRVAIVLALFAERRVKRWSDSCRAVEQLVAAVVILMRESFCLCLCFCPCVCFVSRPVGC